MTVTFLGCIPICVLAIVFWGDLQWRSSLGDFKIFRAAGHAVLSGQSPYVAPRAALLAHHDKFVYPAPVALLFSPFSALPLEVSRIVFLALSVLALGTGLWLLGVRDWRCYGASLLLPPLLDDLLLGAMSCFLLLGLAVVWRFRDRLVPVSIAVAVLVLAKLLLWPVGLWLLATRRYRAAGASLLAAVALVLGGWTLIGFAGFREYPRLLHMLAKVEARDAYSLTGLLSAHGVGISFVTGLLTVLGAVAVVLVSRGADGDRRGFTIAIAVALLASPIVWLHYLVVLLAPIALARPYFSALWCMPFALWLSPWPHSDGSALRTLFVLAVVAAIVGVAYANPSPGGRLAESARALRFVPRRKRTAPVEGSTA